MKPPDNYDLYSENAKAAIASTAALLTVLAQNFTMIPTALGKAVLEWRDSMISASMEQQQVVARERLDLLIKQKFPHTKANVRHATIYELEQLLGIPPF